MRGMCLLVLVMSLVSCKTTSENRRGLTGARGEHGESGVKGKDGTSCSSRMVEAGIEIQCVGQNPTVLPFAASGAAGAAGKDGISCAITKTEADGVTLNCPDKNNPTGIIEFKVKNGTDGQKGDSCRVDYKTSDSTYIICGDSRFVVSNGEQGRTGAQGQTGAAGKDGKNGQNNYTTTLMDALITNKVTTSSTTIECKTAFRSNDEEFRFRWVRAEITADGKSLSMTQNRAANMFESDGILRAIIRTDQDMVSKDRKLGCTFSIYAEQAVYAISLTSKSSSPEITVLDDGLVLPSATSFEYSAPTFASDGLSVELKLKSSNVVTGSKCGYRLLTDVWYTTHPDLVEFFNGTSGTFVVQTEPTVIKLMNKLELDKLDKQKTIVRVGLYCIGDSAKLELYSVPLTIVPKPAL